jgi:hypothetical protein
MIFFRNNSHSHSHSHEIVLIYQVENDHLMISKKKFDIKDQILISDKNIISYKENEIHIDYLRNNIFLKTEG